MISVGTGKAVQRFFKAVEGRLATFNQFLKVIAVEILAKIGVTNRTQRRI